MSKSINKRVEELKKQNYYTKPQNLPRFKNPYLLKSSTEVLNEIYNRKGDGTMTAQNPPRGNFNYPNQRSNAPSGNRNTSRGVNRESGAGGSNNRSHPLSRSNAKRGNLRGGQP